MKQRDDIGGLSMIPDKDEFSPEDTVTITVTNKTEQNVIFSDSALGARVYRAGNTNPVQFVRSPAEVVLKPDQSYKIGFALDEPGEYIVKVRGLSSSRSGEIISAETRIKVTKTIRE
jgi:hypothetical protein